MWGNIYVARRFFSDFACNSLAMVSARALQTSTETIAVYLSEENVKQILKQPDK